MHAIICYPLFLPNLFSPIDLGILVILVLIIFGPGKLPDVLRSLGDGVRQFKDAANKAQSHDVEITATPPPKALPPEEKDDSPS